MRYLVNKKMRGFPIDPPDGKLAFVIYVDNSWIRYDILEAYSLNASEGQLEIAASDIYELLDLTRGADAIQIVNDDTDEVMHEIYDAYCTRWELSQKYKESVYCIKFAWNLKEI